MDSELSKVVKIDMEKYVIVSVVQTNKHEVDIESKKENGYW